MMMSELNALHWYIVNNKCNDSCYVLLPIRSKSLPNTNRSRKRKHRETRIVRGARNCCCWAEYKWNCDARHRMRTEWLCQWWRRVELFLTALEQFLYTMPIMNNFKITRAGLIFLILWSMIWQHCRDIKIIFWYEIPENILNIYVEIANVGFYVRGRKNRIFDCLLEIFYTTIKTLAYC